MKKRIFLLITIFFYFILVFCIQKIIFILCNSDINVASSSIREYFSVLGNGFPMDMSMSGYLTALPAFLIIASIGINKNIIRNIFNVYFAIIGFFIMLIFIVDIVIYPHWGFHFDATIFIYLASPKDAMASGTIMEMVLGTLGCFFGTFIFYIGYKYIIQKQVNKLDPPKSYFKTALVMLFLTASLFLPIRGGVSTSTMNVGTAYFSENMFLNHSAVNPQFNLMYSFGKMEDFAQQYNFYDRVTADKMFDELMIDEPSDSIPEILNTKKPNIILFTLESFSGNVAYVPEIAPRFCEIAEEGINFSNFYANSFRTDRGQISVYAGFPSHPTVAFMKYPQKTQYLPTIQKSLKEELGYHTSFYYGGDADFTNMRSFWVGACGIGTIIEDKSFPLKYRTTKWGVPDAPLMQRIFDDVTNNTYKEPFMATVMTLSSHEPYDVPTKRFDEPFLNSIAYTDSCIGDFVDKLKKDKLWDNTLLIFVPDHTMWYPRERIKFNDFERFQIPMVWTGGAIKEAMDIPTYASQKDIAATLLSQLGLNHDDFIFSKDILSPNNKNPFGFYSYQNGVAVASKDGRMIYDLDMDKVVHQEGDTSLVAKGKTIFQRMYIELGER